VNGSHFFFSNYSETSLFFSLYLSGMSMTVVDTVTAEILSQTGGAALMDR
jgi:hypothetical protein